MILAFDPGGTTGVAFYNMPVIEAWEISVSDHHIDIRDTIIRNRPTLLIYEGFDWRPYRNKKVDLTPVEYIGVIKLVAFNARLPLIEQKPHQKEWWTDDKLKRVGQYRPGKPHANDAVRHLLYYLMNKTSEGREWLEELR